MQKQLRYKAGTYGYPDSEGGDWIMVDSTPFQSVSSGSGVVLAVRATGELVQRTGITCSLPQGTGWTNLLNNMTRVDTYETVAWAVDTTGDMCDMSSPCKHRDNSCSHKQQRTFSDLEIC
ncbi:hypothetical protein C0Q70_13008 [Pomacea canaliculata]|uniref:Uncharacterized protein n=1 Tax=Pomacea canaliculata TaxID=400727 RepID=A0A2T7P366_POMCA|nr:hypothetical protein C0Q70_13008 [Pomacea canaliculata]